MHSNKKEIPEAIKKLKKLAGMYAQCFSTQAGIEVLAHLERVYMNVSVFNKDPIIMARNAGTSDLVREIIQMIDSAASEKEKPTDG